MKAGPVPTPITPISVQTSTRWRRCSAGMLPSRARGRAASVVVQNNHALVSSASAAGNPQKEKPKQSAPTGPRDPAASLSEDQRETYSALAVRGVGREEAAVLATDDALRGLFESVASRVDDPADAGNLVVHDFRRALELKPDWDLAEWQLSRFEISTN